ncbi:aryl-sulfate sulfotransferase [Sutterella massiliensis]|uniref:Aryl-sulfate sulfotransferase n=1 Tax=Sutterella massiliensis TaxID=1816689 RepID=A0ABS2DSY4_9BURK|nr:aryl-sulfate sulfotransferase [Sutterella massiliensis]
MSGISRRDFARLTVFAAAAAAVPMVAHAFGGPSGPSTIYKKQKIGEVIMNPYKIAPLTAIIRNGGYELRNASVRIVPKEGGQEIAYKVSDSQLLTHGGIPVFGLYPDYRNKVEVTYDRIFYGKTERITETYTMATNDIFGLHPFPKAVVRKAAPAKFADRLYYINNIGGNNNTRHAVWNNPEGGALQWSSYPLNMIIDTKGDVRWYLYPIGIYDVDSLYDGGIMMGLRQNEDGAITWGYGQHYVKYDIMGREIWNRRLPYGYNDFSHTMDAAQNGHYFLRVASSNLKRSDGRNVRTVRDMIVEVDQNGNVVEEWRLWEILDPYRDTAIKALDQGAVCLNIDPKLAGKTLSSEDLQKLDKEAHFGDIVGTGPGRNWAHVNSVDYDPTDDSIIISSRHQCAVIKIGRDKKVKWILGAPRGWKKPWSDALLTPVDANGKPLACGDAACENTNFDWTWTQHTAFRIDSKSDKKTIFISVFDNGDGRGFDQPPLPDMKYSRAVIYKIDQEKRTVEQIWEYGKEMGHEWFSPVTSLVEYMPDKDSIIAYAATAGANYDLKTGGLTSAPNPYLDEFEWGSTTPAVEIQLKNTTGYQAFAFDVNKAFNGKIM